MTYKKRWRGEQLQSKCGAATTDWRQEWGGGLGGACEGRLVIGDDWRVDGAVEALCGVLRRGGGFQRWRLLLVAQFVSARGSTLNLVGDVGRLIEGFGRWRRKGSIS